MRKRIRKLLILSLMTSAIIGCDRELSSNSEDALLATETDILESESIKNTQVDKSEETDRNQEELGQDKDGETDFLEGQKSWIEPLQSTIEGRILLPEGFERKKGNSYGEYMRALPLLADGSFVYLYNGNEKSNQNNHVAVLDIDVGTKDLQQCADAALRIRCEFLFQSGDFEGINYHLTNGDEFPYSSYRDGYRLQVEGNQTSLVKTADRDESYEGFRKYLEVLYTYAGTISVQAESSLIQVEAMEIGDIFIIGGSPGHCVIVMDICENVQGEVKFLLGQSFMPAQEIHILKNPNSESPWYSVDEIEYPFETPEWTFKEACLRRMP